MVVTHKILPLLMSFYLLFTVTNGQGQVAEPLYDYYMGFFGNFRPDDGDISILLITSETQPVQYSMEAPGVGYYHNGTITAGDEVTLNLSSSIQVSSVYHQNNGIYLTTSSDNVTVIGQNLDSGTSDSFFALPLIELGDEYVYYGISVRRTSVHSFPVNSSILIVGTENNTMMKLTVTQSVNIGVGNIVTTLTPGIQYSFVINRLQTVYIGSPEDLSGTKIVTNKPVSVFSGHQCANIPWDVQACDHLIEQIPPTALWGKVFYIAPLASKTSYTIKALAAYNSTIINVYCNNTMESYTINEGEFINRTSQINEYCAIYSNKEVLVVQLTHGGREDNNNGDPMMTLVPATNQYLDKFDFSTIRNPIHFNHYVNIIVKKQYFQPNMIYLIAGGVNRTLVKQRWVPIEVNNITEAYATQVNISEGVAQIFHTDASAQMMTIVYGFNTFDAYGHIGGLHIPTARRCNLKEIIGKLIKTITEGTVEITFAADDSAADFRCRLDGGQFVNCTSPWTLTDVAKGNHFITIEAKCPNFGKKIRRIFKFIVE